MEETAAGTNSQTKPVPREEKSHEAKQRYICIYESVAKPQGIFCPFLNEQTIALAVPS